jgi:hypothetical protein
MRKSREGSTMPYFDEEDDYTEREPRTLPDFYIEPTAKCGVCDIENSVERRMTLVCNVCGNPTHQECGEDTEPSGGWDRDYDENYWMCKNCLDKPFAVEK